ncbi:MAG: 4Fe-4S ferredoxin [Nitrospirae bacterium CG_4_9_14_3_um_filter_53_35]|nr:MAG: 4Fe-4S ferredoxin [Nitrospirae bacterium CG2_30_53_67]PIS37257.1 MAG: 4Fe-4S ferredoxin [Nitrospirae bacterium CG08_land_8_20_14_0_20_52_24]PIV84813.1 MAG: 4Fe-4S ferredoxin [Nitrospirae bacterium CG17_big_fil_post_rev_8_21_14_2_50_50_9]PIX84581.1 MAG: 4Fe-4S ferredoxin [Nitrospirae bacterium CG_4_10_14_3_um_filter_53_41]PJA77264.1 MAG: 4Fe-4S ferredoxin [Nitrospirae bacterium CG_4_9_14_3_um_filter_53_35]
MPHKITDECILCGACLPECPEEAISEGDPKYIIDPKKCSDCGNCAEVCPTDACVPDE